MLNLAAINYQLPKINSWNMVPMEGVEPTHPYGYQILSLARLPIPPHRLFQLGAGTYRKPAPQRKHYAGYGPVTR